MRIINLLVLVFMFSTPFVSAETAANAAHFSAESKAKSKSFVADMKSRQAEELAKMGGGKIDKKLDEERRFKSLIKHRLNNFKSPVGTTPETVMLYTSLTNLLNEMRDINCDINFLNIEVVESKNDDNVVTQGILITNAYGEDVSKNEALSDMYVLKSRIRAMRADRAAVGLAITLVSMKIAAGTMQMVSGILGAVANSGQMSDQDSKNISEGAAIVAQLSADLGMNAKSLKDLNRFIKDESDTREKAIDQHIENIKAMGGDMGELKF